MYRCDRSIYLLSFNHKTFCAALSYKEKTHSPLAALRQRKKFFDFSSALSLHFFCNKLWILCARALHLITVLNFFNYWTIGKNEKRVVFVLQPLDTHTGARFFFFECRRCRLVYHRNAVRPAGGWVGQWVGHSHAHSHQRHRPLVDLVRVAVLVAVVGPRTALLQK